MGERQLADFKWTPKMDERLRQLYRTMSPTLLAERFGCGASAVTSRAVYIGLSVPRPKKSPAERQQAPVMTRNQRATVASLFAGNRKPMVPELSTLDLKPKLIPLTRTCVYIAGERPYGDNPYCGALTRRDPDGIPCSPYCEEHHTLCYQGKPKRALPQVNENTGRYFI